jgi:RHS repeat-associated protein
VSFDILGRVLNHQQITDGNTYDTAYAYNLSGALIEETYPSGRKVKNTLDIDGKLSQVQSSKANETLKMYANSFNYNASGVVASVRLGNGRFENTQFNSRLQPTQIGLGSNAASQNLLKLNFDYGVTDNNGNVKSQTITTPTVGNIAGFTAVQTYNYDSLNRIKEATENINNNQTPNWKQTFIYDRYGNRKFDTANNKTTTLQTGCPVNICNPSANTQNNKLIGTNYDEVGNTKIEASGQSYTYDAENKMVKAKTSSGATLGDYFYDGDGKRIKKIVPNGETTIFVYDADDKMVAEYSTVIASQADANISYLTSDHLGSPRINTDATGKVIARHDMMPFGEEILRAENGMDSVRQKFTGYERDTETDLDFAQARMYNKNHGRFTSPDEPFNDQFEDTPQSWNLYSYVRNNPLNLIDPLGMAAGCPPDYPNCIERDGKYYNVQDGVEAEIDTTPIPQVETREKLPSNVETSLMQRGRGGRWNNFDRAMRNLGGWLRNWFGPKNTPNQPKPSTPPAQQPSGGNQPSQPNQVYGPPTPPIVGPSPILQFSKNQLQRKFKHAGDFGVQGNYNANTAQQFQQAIQTHINSMGTQVTNGTYRGQPVIHYTNILTGVNVITGRDGSFISGWKLNPAQIQNVTTRGSL